jgi:hypothetical protein
MSEHRSTRQTSTQTQRNGKAAEGTHPKGITRSARRLLMVSRFNRYNLIVYTMHDRGEVRIGGFALRLMPASSMLCFRFNEPVAHATQRCLNLANRDYLAEKT